MCECVVKRQSNTAEKIIEYRTKEGLWGADQSEALRSSEEDAKAIVRTLEQADRPPALYSYDTQLVAE